MKTIKQVREYCEKRIDKLMDDQDFHIKEENEVELIDCLAQEQACRNILNFINEDSDDANTTK